MKTDTMNRLIYNDKFLKICHYWSRMRPKTRKEHIEQLSNESGFSVSAIYRSIRRYRDGNIRKAGKRSDRGRPKICSIEEKEYYVKSVMGLKSHDPKKPKKILNNPEKSMSTARAITIAEKLGLVPEGLLTVRTLNRWAKELGMTCRDICSPRPAVKLVSNHPNHVFLVDFSVCEQYYLSNKSKIKVRAWTYKNKPNEAKEKIWSFALVDHFSGCAYVEYFLAKGENSQIFYKGLVNALSKKNNTQFPFHGAPKILYGDKGASWKSSKMQNLLKALNIKFITHMPGNPRAKGMVESLFSHVQKDFESELRFCAAPTIAELNDRMNNWLINHNRQAKAGETISRFQKWQEIKQEQLLELPSINILNRVAASYITRTVDAYCNISVDGETFGVPEDVAGKKVRVWYNIDGGISVQDMETGDMYQNVEPRTAVFGEFRAHKRNNAERMQDDAIRMAGENIKLITPEMLRRDEGNIHWIERAGATKEIDSELVPEATDEYETIYQAKVAIADDLRMNLSDLPGWMLESIENELKKTLKVEMVHKIARYVEGFLREQQAAV